MDITGHPDQTPRRFTVTVADGLLNDAQAADVEQAIRRAVADTFAALDLAHRVEHVDPMREQRVDGPVKGFDWRSVMHQSYTTPGMITVLNPFVPPALDSSSDPTPAPRTT